MTSPRSDMPDTEANPPLTPPESLEDEKSHPTPNLQGLESRNAGNGEASSPSSQRLKDGDKRGQMVLPGDDEDDDEPWLGPVRYTKEYVDVTGAVTRRVLGDAPVAVSPDATPGVVEVITKWHWGGNFGKARPLDSKMQKQQYLDKLVGRKGTSRFRIHSAKLINALRAVVDYYPGQDLLGDVVEFNEPFCFLVHHWDKLEQYKSNHPPQHTAEYQKECNEHIDLLLNLLDKQIGKEVKKEKKRHSQGVATFEYLWVLFKPGEKLFRQHSRITRSKLLSPCLLDRVEGGVVDRKEKPYRVVAWYIGYNGLRFERYDLAELIRPFDGEKEIMALPIYPQAYHKDSEEEIRAYGGRTLQEQCLVWGERFWDLRWPCQKEYSGICLLPRRIPTVNKYLIPKRSCVM
jgi:hypothetical protein